MYFNFNCDELRYQWYSTNPIVIFLWFLCGMKCYQPLLKKGGSFNVLNNKPYVVTYHLKRIIPYKKIMTIRKSHLQHSWPKRQPVIVDQLSNFGRLPFWIGLEYTPVSCTFVFISPCHLKQDVSQKGLTIKTLSYPQNGSLR